MKLYRGISATKTHLHIYDANGVHKNETRIKFWSTSLEYATEYAHAQLLEMEWDGRVADLSDASVQMELAPFFVDFLKESDMAKLSNCKHALSWAEHKLAQKSTKKAEKEVEKCRKELEKAQSIIDNFDVATCDKKRLNSQWSSDHRWNIVMRNALTELGYDAFYFVEFNTGKTIGIL